MKIREIKVGQRARQTVGWLDDLERSIEQLGVLQPIGVTRDNELIFGERRLQACKNLGMQDIPARVIDINADDPAAALKMEQAENNIRRDFTPSEKVEIARRIEEALAGRNGVRHDSKTALQNFAEVKGNSRDIAAEAVGWSGETYRQAKKVIEEGSEETKAALDSGDVSVSAAYKQTRQPAAKPPKVFSVRLASDPQPDAQSILRTAGKEYSESLAMALLNACGAEVNVQ